MEILENSKRGCSIHMTYFCPFCRSPLKQSELDVSSFSCEFYSCEKCKAKRNNSSVIASPSKEGRSNLRLQNGQTFLRLHHD
jgi:hypothetical protein